ncbi:HAD family hydrolase [Tropicimonas sp. TH_r6]|uniref:HAD family hydrolase n=1 Tax=Tropicimonas sp. TH_r6 TaxID=3082085 RepID=UPI0029530C1A|nr:HAD family hydrolase [Tropicimonas sp. TH_r6]MDV7144235.1 HAD family hydrolase [Tropicimonas sp. TH_r6]
MAEIRGLLFDKDGTLFDFQATWGGWAADLMTELADGVEARAEDLAARIRLDRPARRFHPDSILIAGTTDDAVEALLPGLPHLSYEGLYAKLIESTLTIPPAVATPLAPLMDRFRSAGFVLGVATNDAESAARAQLDALDVTHCFDFIVGADSGHGAKPAPGQCLAFCAATGLLPHEVAMIGDSTHDLYAGQAAGMVPIAVLTGPAGSPELAPHAAAVLPDIGHLPAWLDLP